MEMRSGFRKRSKSRSYFRGSMPVMPRQVGTRWSLRRCRGRGPRRMPCCLRVIHIIPDDEEIIVEAHFPDNVQFVFQAVTARPAGRGRTDWAGVPGRAFPDRRGRFFPLRAGDIWADAGWRNRIPHGSAWRFHRCGRWRRRRRGIFRSISASLLTYISSVCMRMRFSSERVLPVWIHMRISWAKASWRVR